MKTLIAAFMFAVLAACGGSKGTTGPTTTGPTPTTAAAGTVELADLTFFDGDEPAMKLHADGSLEVRMRHTDSGKPPEDKWQTIGALSADGTITHEGKAHGQFKPDGTFVTSDGKTMPFKVDADALVVGDKKITIDDQGNVQGGNPGFKLRVDGAKTPGLRRTALAVLALMEASEPEKHTDAASGGGY